MKSPYYDKATNSVFLRGALNPINPETNQAWQNEQEALAFVASLPCAREAVTLGKAATGITAKLMSKLAFIKRR
ncbi:hypothetical protein [Thalassomonas haliotis]|uniref:Uncharacterized protein n=1 Tax=Thalassomonas haliotis TaxID=485448 RepID=A0ABY7VBX7_9GAMM|nr:hypothetical protein [Thalassomonas haliotis]WDE11147.1 hypothetical protein H3N35_23390 [Thalassomonas haliotis]